MNLKLNHVDAYGVQIAYFESQSGSCSDKTLLFVHGMGCHARCWDATLKLLNTSYRTICVELRGHGRSEKRRPYSWDQFGKDLSSFIQVLDLNPIVAVGHSLGGHALLQAAAVLTRRFEALFLLEPVVYYPDAYSDSAFASAFDSPEDHPFARRRLEWNSSEELLAFLQDRNPFKLWDAAVLRDHCTYGLEPAADGQYQLCCPPLVEAEIALSVTDTNVHPLLSFVDVPVTIVRAKSAPGFRHPKDTIHSVTWPQLARNLPQGTDKQLDDVSHFIPMQRPDVVACELNAYLQDPATT
ncbi:MAG: alpha/beta hydrolase [Gammaproteobacteria bacterium]|nr:alpha/beta hydrolase [Gammaproteobacteria bacterium]